MAFFLMILSLIAIVVGTVGSIWLLIHAFQKSVGWGLAAFFIPFAIIVFGILNFRDSKKPFLLMVGGTAAGIVFSMIGSFMIAADMANQFEQMAAEMEQAQLEEMQSEDGDDYSASFEDVAGALNSNQDGAQVDQINPMTGEPMTEGEIEDKLARLAELGDESAGDDPGAGDMVLEALSPPRAEPTMIPLNQASGYEGALVRVKGKDGMRAKGRLLRVTNGSFFIERNLGAGTVSFEIARSDVAGLELIRR